MDQNAITDPYDGVGGSYAIDPVTGQRVQIVAPPGWPVVVLPAVGTSATAIVGTRPWITAEIPAITTRAADE